jgi:hypothetical protein
MIDKFLLDIISGDDYTFGVNFMDGCYPVELTEGDAATLIIHSFEEGEDDIEIEMLGIEDNSAKFYISKSITSSLARGEITNYDYSVRIQWASGSVNTPIFR